MAAIVTLQHALNDEELEILRAIGGHEEGVKGSAVLLRGARRPGLRSRAQAFRRLEALGLIHYRVADDWCWLGARAAQLLTTLDTDNSHHWEGDKA